MSPIQPSGSSGDTPPFKAQYTVSPAFKKFWETLFHNAPLTKQQLSEMTDAFIHNVANQMNNVLQWAIRQQKKRHEEEKKEGF